jgi:thiol-disulfide isomerase/thioredoxin
VGASAAGPPRSRPGWGLAPTRRLIAATLLATATSSPAHAEPAATATLLKHLNVVAYRPGTTAPNFTGLALDGAQVSLAMLRGKVVLVNFWATWCAECRPEMPVLERLHRELTPKGFAVVGINAREERSAIAPYASQLGLTFPLIVDLRGRNSDLYGVVGIPTTFLFARDGRAVGLAVGPRDWGGGPARELIELLLAESPPRTP